MIKESPENWNDHWQPEWSSREYMETQLKAFELVLSTRLTNETIRGIINFMKATIPGTPIKEIERALV